MGSGIVSNFFDVIINEVGFVTSIIAICISFYLLKFKMKDMSKIQRMFTLILFIVSLLILSMFIYLSIGFGRIPENIPEPIAK